MVTTVVEGVEEGEQVVVEPHVVETESVIGYPAAPPEIKERHVEPCGVVGPCHFDRKGRVGVQLEAVED